MTNPIRALAKREVLGALRSPRYYILLGFYAFVQGYLFSILFIDDGAAAFRQLTRDAAFLLLLASPLLTSGSLAGERDSGELRHLLSEPISEWTLVGGKALGSFLLLLPLPLLATIPAIAAHLTADTPLGPMIVALLGLVLVAATCAAAGIFTSSFASHPAAAAVCAMGLLLGLGFVGVQAARAEEALSFLLGGTGSGALNPFWLADFLFRGVIDTRPLVFFPVATILFLYMGVLVLRSQRRSFGEREQEQGRGWSRGPLVAKHLAISALPALVGFGILHTINIHWYAARDLSGFLNLAPGTIQLISTLDQPARIYRVPSRSGGRDRLADFLDEVARKARGSVILGTWSPTLHQGELRHLGLLIRPADGIVVRLGSKVQALGMADLDVESRDAERALVSALENLLPSPPSPSILFTEGNDERPLPILRRLLATAGLESAAVDLRSADATIPSTTVLVMAAPRAEPSMIELSRIHNHLDGSGSLLLCMDPESGGFGRSVAALVGVTSEAGVIHDQHRHLAGGGPTALLLNPTKDHPATKHTGRATIVIPGAMPLRNIIPAEDPLRRDLFVTLGTARLVPFDCPSGFEEGTPGNWVVGLTVEGPHTVNPFRAAVIGDVDLFDDRLLGYETNAMFAVSLISWLTGKRIPDYVPRKPYVVRPVLDRDEARTLLYSVSVIPAFFWFGLGFLAWLAHRQRVAGRHETINVNLS